MKKIAISIFIISIFILPYILLSHYSSPRAQIIEEQNHLESIKQEGPFLLKKKSGPNDWLTNHIEDGQTFTQFKNSDDIIFPDSINNIIYLQPFGLLDEDSIFNIKIAAEFLEIYYGLNVKISKRVEKDVLKSFTTRDNNGIVQTHANDFLNYLYNNMPYKCYSIMALTQSDLYPDESWNYVFGMASLSHRVGVTSLARYDNSFFTNNIEDRDRILIRKRALKVIAHETGHMFGMHHCIFYECLMNGSNHQKESDSQPMTLCPICLKKIEYSTKIDANKRYENLLKFYDKFGMEKEKRAIEEIIQFRNNKQK